MTILNSRLLKKSSNRKSKLLQAMQDSTWLSSTAQVSFAANLAENFVCYWFSLMPEPESQPDIVSKVLRMAVWSSCALWLESEQEPFSRTDCWFRSAALHWHSIQFGICWFFSTPCFIQRPTNDRKIERSNEHCFGQSQVFRKSIEI